MKSDHTAIAINFDPLTRRMKGYTTHGSKYFDVPYMTEVGENLWIGGCEDGLILPETIKNVVSLYPWESYTVEHDMSSYMTVTMYDSTHEEVNLSKILHMAMWVNECRKEAPTLVHCQAGLNRSGLVTAAAIMLQDGVSAQEAIDIIRTKRSSACLCNPTFVQVLNDLEWYING